MWAKTLTDQCRTFFFLNFLWSGIFNDVLDCNICVSILQDVNKIIVCSDFNTDLRRTTSLHTIALNYRFLARESLKPGIQHVLSDVDCTYLNKINGERSIIDQFLSRQSIQYYISSYESEQKGVYG